jgi:hypothetical protein
MRPDQPARRQGAKAGFEGKEIIHNLRKLRTGRLQVGFGICGNRGESRCQIAPLRRDGLERKRPLKDGKGK